MENLKRLSLLVCISLSVAACRGGGDDNTSPVGPSTFPLTVNKTGAGTITSSPAGISCGATCNASFPAGTQVTLTAVPVAGSAFIGWSGGGCTGAATCAVTMDANKTVNAAFTSGTATLGEVVALTSTGSLISFNRATPDVRSSGPIAVTLPAGETLLGIDYRPNGNKLYGLAKATTTMGTSTTATGKLYELSPLTGVASNPKPLCLNATDVTTCAASLVPFASASATEYGVDFNPVVDRLRIVGSDNQNLRVNVDTGATLVDPNVTGGLASAAAYTNNFPGLAGTVPGTVLYAISAATDQLFTLNTSTNALTVVGNLGVDAGAVNGFEISGSGVNRGEAIAALTVAGVARFFRIDLATGEATTIGTIVTGEATGTQIRGLSAPVAGTFTPAGNTFALLGTGQLVSFNRAAPATILTRTLISSLASGDQVVAMDFRPKDRKLYALGRLANIYTIDTNSGAATLVTALSADPADTTAPVYAGLNSGANFGMDFNPVADSSKDDPAPPSLRIVDSSSQNLRVPVEGANLGKVTRDMNTNRDNPNDGDPPLDRALTASAYTNGFNGAANTTLYGIDSNNDRLVTQALAAATGVTEGELFDVGAPFGFDVEGVNGFDVDALTGEGFAGMRVGGVNKLYRINLASGVATDGGLIGDGTLDVRGLALKVPKPAVVFGLTDKTDALNMLVGFDPLLPGMFITGPTAIRGLAGGDELIGIDFRPSDKALIAVSKSGNIYSLATTATVPPGGGAASHAATLLDSMEPSVNDNTAPFSQLVGTEFGFDFDQILPANATGLRIVGDSGASYVRTDTLSGETFTDAPLTRPSPPPPPPSSCGLASGALMIGGAAYSGNNTLYVIDVNPTSPCVYTAPAGGGALSAVGSALLPIAVPPGNVLDPGAIAGFDIAGALNGLVAAALEPAGGVQSSFYRVSLGNGAASLVGVIGPAGSARIRSIAIQLLPPE